MEDLSDRECERFMAENVAGKWFCGLPSLELHMKEHFLNKINVSVIGVPSKTRYLNFCMLSLLIVGVC